MFRSYYVDKHKKLVQSALSTYKAQNPEVAKGKISKEVYDEITNNLPCVDQLDVRPVKYDSVVKYYEWDQDTETLVAIDKDMEVEINYFRDSYDYKKFFSQTKEFMNNSSGEIYGDFRVQQNSSLGDFYNDEKEVQKQMDLFEAQQAQQGNGVDESNKENSTPKTDENGDKGVATDEPKTN